MYSKINCLLRKCSQALRGRRGPVWRKWSLRPIPGGCRPCSLQACSSITCRLAGLIKAVCRSVPDQCLMTVSQCCCSGCTDDVFGFTGVGARITALSSCLSQGWPLLIGQSSGLHEQKGRHQAGAYAVCARARMLKQKLARSAGCGTAKLCSCLPPPRAETRRGRSRRLLVRSRRRRRVTNHNCI